MRKTTPSTQRIPRTIAPRGAQGCGRSAAVLISTYHVAREVALPKAGWLTEATNKSSLACAVVRADKYVYIYRHYER